MSKAMKAAINAPGVQVITQPSAPIPVGATPIREPVREAVREAVIPQGVPGAPSFLGRNGEVLTIKRLDNANPFEIPEMLKDKDYSYEWKRDEIYGQQDIAHQVQLAENGWRPVLVEPGSRWSGAFMPANYTGPIRRNGMMLMERPAGMTAYVRAYEKQKADDLVKANHNRYVNRQAVDVPNGFTTHHSGVTPNISQSYEPGPPQGKHQLVVE